MDSGPLPCGQSGSKLYNFSRRAPLETRLAGCHVTRARVAEGSGGDRQRESGQVGDTSAQTNKGERLSTRSLSPPRARPEPHWRGAPNWLAPLARRAGGQLAICERPSRALWKGRAHKTPARPAGFGRPRAVELLILHFFPACLPAPARTFPFASASAIKLSRSFGAPLERTRWAQRVDQARLVDGPTAGEVENNTRPAGAQLAGWQDSLRLSGAIVTQADPSERARTNQPETSGVFVCVCVCVCVGPTGSGARGAQFELVGSRVPPGSSCQNKRRAARAPG